MKKPGQPGPGDLINFCVLIYSGSRADLAHFAE
jgi:hypothetical protein